MRNKLKKLAETKNELIQQIKAKDEAILELSKFYDVSIQIFNYFQKINEKKEKKENKKKEI